MFLYGSKGKKVETFLILYQMSCLLYRLAPNKNILIVLRSLISLCSWGVSILTRPERRDLAKGLDSPASCSR